jgi:hypothetical protein
MYNSIHESCLSLSVPDKISDRVMESSDARAVGELVNLTTYFKIGTAIVTHDIQVPFSRNSLMSRNDLFNSL